MGSDTPGYGPDFDPSGCNSQALINPDDPSGKCRPLWDAKQAAKTLVDYMFEGYDQIAVVTFDFSATMQLNLETNFTTVKNAIDGILLHDDLDQSIVLSYGNPVAGDMNPLDVNGDGTLGDSFLSTCTGCGIRVAGTLLKTWGRDDSVWVIVFLSDGATNVSDVPPVVDSSFPNGYCGGSINNRMWTKPWCTDSDPATRHCGPYHDDNPSKCPPGAIFDSGSPDYDVEDYARDMIDQTALLTSSNPNEPLVGNDIAIYSIGLGVAATPPDYDGEQLLRYMANVGDDGSRANDPCAGVPPQTNCGNYYYAPDASYLAQIFENIANRIYTRISQ